MVPRFSLFIVLLAIGCQSASLSHAPGEWADGPAPGFHEADTLADFVQTLKGRKKFAPGFHDGVAVQAVLESAQKAAQGRRWVKVPG